MEDHEKRMRNLIKKVHDLGGTATDTQFRRIVISSMPPDWRQDVRSVPGTSSADAFTYIHTLWYEKGGRKGHKASQSFDDRSPIHHSTQPNEYWEQATDHLPQLQQARPYREKMLG